jgi:hypothetical protein
MSFQVLGETAQSLNPILETDRHSANFHPSIWGDHFLAYASELVKIPSFFFFFFSLIMLFLMR